ncbi:MAG: FtsX-like permease family protein [Planctomycetota bacterium]
MQSRLIVILFTLLAPIAVPAYILFLGFSNLLGGAFYIVIEASVARIARRPITLSWLQMVLLAVPVLAAAPLATAVHLAIWFVLLSGRMLRWLGRWQAGVERSPVAFACGLVWALATLWTIVTCLNAAMGLSLIGKPLEGREAFVQHVTRPRPLGQMPPDMQERRRELIQQLKDGKEEVHPQWVSVLEDLEDDEYLFLNLPNTMCWRLAGLPWFFIPKEVARDGLDHSQLLLGPLLFAVLLFVRWPGTFVLLKCHRMRFSWFVLRTVAATGAIYLLATWISNTAYSSFYYEDEVPSWTFSLLSPAAWLSPETLFGFDYRAYARPEWYLFNAGLWLAIVGVVLFVWWLAWRISPFLGWPRYYVAFLASRLLQRKRIAFFSVGAVTLCVAMMIIVISVMGGFVDSIRARAHGLLGDLVVDGGLQGFPYYEEYIKRIGELRDETTGRPIVEQATPLIHTFGILQFPRTKKTKAVSIWGVRLDEYVRVNEFGKNLFYNNRFGGTVLTPQEQPVYGFNKDDIAVLPGDMDRRYQTYLGGLPEEERAEEESRFGRVPNESYRGPGVFEMSSELGLAPGFRGPAFPGIIIGRDIMARRMPSGEYRRSEEYPRGEPCYLTVLPLTRGGDVSPEPPPKPMFRYVDDSRTGIHEIDTMNVYVDFDELQRLLSMEAMQRADGSGMASARCGQIQVKLSRPFGDTKPVLQAKKRQIMEVWETLRREAPSDHLEDLMMAQVDVQTWEEMQRDFISAIEKEKFLVLIMFGVISVVAVFLILCIFYMIVQEKTRDIGIIKSVGGSAEGVAAVFLAYGGAIGLVGCVLGALLGTTFVEHINDVQEWLARLNPDWRVWSPETYSFDKIPDQWKWAEVIWIGILAVLASILGATLPALRASRTWPVESLRYE